MESSRPRPPGVLDAAALPGLGAVFDDPGPFVTVYLDTDPAVANAAALAEGRWGALRGQLGGDGAPEALLRAIDPLVKDAHTLGCTLVAVAGAGGARLVRNEPEPPTRDWGRFAALPSVGPALEWAQQSVPHVVVLADRAGADLVAFTRSGEEHVGSVGDHDGHDPDLHRSSPGGWSQKRYQQRAENLWEERAGEVAGAVAALVDEVGARLVVVAGDVRAVQFLREALPSRIDDLIREVPGARAAGASIDTVAESTVRLAATVAAEDTVACLQRLKDEAGGEGRAARGADATLAALSEARVDVLLFHDDPDDERGAFFGPGPNLVSADEATLIGLGVAEPARARLVDAAVRAALGTGAGVRVVPDVVPDGLAALLRY